MFHVSTNIVAKYWKWKYTNNAWMTFMYVYFNILLYIYLNICQLIIGKTKMFDFSAAPNVCKFSKWKFLDQLIHKETAQRIQGSFLDINLNRSKLGRRDDEHQNQKIQTSYRRHLWTISEVSRYILSFSEGYLQNIRRPENNDQLLDVFSFNT